MLKITEEQVEKYQGFFEQCAIDYGVLAGKLIKKLVDYFELALNPDLPLITLNAHGNNTYQQSGEMENWIYFFHGYHCRFTHKISEQSIEIPLTYGSEFGVLDPYFYVEFIKTTSKYYPLPIIINDSFHDGCIILDVMLRIGKFEIINSNLKEDGGMIVKKRIPQKVKVYTEKEFIKAVYGLDIS